MNTTDSSEELNSTSLSKCFETCSINGLTLKNRFIKASTFEHMTPGGIPGKALSEFHGTLADGGIAMTTIGYCAVENDGRLYASMMYMGEHVREPLTELIDSLHKRGTKVAGQLGHGGGFSQNSQLSTNRPKGPSFGLNLLGMPKGMYFCDAMTVDEIDALVRAYHDAAVLMKSVGFDAFEIHFGHGYGLCQFLSPKTNKRKDEYGGSFNNRMRLPLRVLQAVREGVGPEFPLLAKISLTEGVPGGLQLSDAIQLSKQLDANGIDAIIPSMGTSTMTPMLMFRGRSMAWGMLKYEKNFFMKLAYIMAWPFMFRAAKYKELYLLEHAKRIKEAVNCKVAYVGGASTNESFTALMNERFDFIELGRALLCNPDLPLQAKQNTGYKSDCDHCNDCIGTIAHENGIHCPCAQNH